MIKVGITGGIGSGKTTVCNIFKTLNVPVYNADLEARELTNTHPNIIKSISKIFGKDIYIEGILDRKKVGSMVFTNSDLLTKLNRIIHPVVAWHFKEWLTLHQHHKYIIKEAAVLFESGGNKTLDKIITVSAPENLRINRVMHRDKLTEEEVRSRMGKQMLDEEKIRMSDYVLYCNDIDLLIPQVLLLHKKITI